MIPAPTPRIRFRELTEADLDAMAALLGDSRVMTYYPVPLDRAGAAAWIARNRERYAEHGHGLWRIESLDGEFLGDCGLTWQPTDRGSVLEVGYHLRPEVQGRGYATEAAAACRDLARDVLGAHRLSAIVHPDNTASRAVAERIGMIEERRFATPTGTPAVLMSMPLH